MPNANLKIPVGPTSVGDENNNLKKIPKVSQALSRCKKLVN